MRNRRDLCFLILKAVLVVFVLGEMSDHSRYMICLLERHDFAEFLLRLIRAKIILAIFFAGYMLAKYFRRKGVSGRAVFWFLILGNISTLWLNGSVFGIFFWDGPYWGRVTDADTGEPVAGASIIGKWQFQVYQLYVGRGCIHADVRETVTGDSGYFFLTPARAFSLWPGAQIRLEDIIVFKSGYRILFTKRGRDYKIYKLTILRLNKAKSPEEQREAAAVSLSDVPFCEDKIKIPMINEAVSKEKIRLYK